MVSLLRGGRRALVRESGTRPVSVYGLLGGGAAESPEGLDVYVAPDLLADLYEPRLIITADYIGPERRRRRDGRPVDGRRRSTRMGELAVVALVTAAAVIPITLVASHAGAQPPSTQPAVRSVVAASTGPAPHRRGSHHQGGAQRFARLADRALGIGPGPGMGTARLATRGAAGSSPATICNGTSAAAISPRCVRAQAASERRAERAARLASRAERKLLAEATTPSRPLPTMDRPTPNRRHPAAAH